MDVIRKSEIEFYLNANVKEFADINIVNTCESTNTELKKHAIDGKNEGYILIARRQTGGRGRMGRVFFSPDDTGVYMSILLRPNISPKDVSLITSVAAVCVSKALEKIGVEMPKIKWVNDIFINGKKVCGILTEGSFKNERETEYAILGIGINFYEPKGGFPEDIKDTAGAVFAVEAEGLKNRLIAYTLNEFFTYYRDLLSRTHISEYKSRCMCLGEKISVISGSDIRNGTALDIDNNCGLVVKYDDGEIATVSTGEISVKLR